MLKAGEYCVSFIIRIITDTFTPSYNYDYGISPDWTDDIFCLLFVAETTALQTDSSHMWLVCIRLWGKRAQTYRVSLRR